MVASRTIKVWVWLAWLAVSPGAPAPAPRGDLYLDIIDMAAISRMSPQQLEQLAEGLAAEEIMRTKRSSAQAVTSVVSKASSGIQSKIGLLGQASAFISSASSKSGGDQHPGYSYEPQHDEKYDYWGLKKSILYTLFQAVKAITGGVTILKGQLIKGGGALASTLGKVIAGKGDAVSNLGKKIVSSAALSEKKPHSTAVYGPPPTTHIEYGPPPAVYGAPTAPAHYHTGPSLPTGYAAHKYPSTLDGGGALGGLHAGVVLLAPLAGNPRPHGHAALEPPSSILTSVVSAIKNAFSTVSAPAPYASAPYPPSASGAVEEPYSHQPPPPPQHVPDFRPVSWDSPALDSYGAPAVADAYSDYDPRHQNPPFDYSAKHASVVDPTYKTGLTPEKIQKINFNVAKLNHYMSQQARSSEDVPKFAGLEAYRHLLERGPLLPTQVVTDNEIGVLPAELLPDLDSPAGTSTPALTSTPPPAPTSTASEPPPTTVAERRKDYKYFLKGNRIILV